MSPGHKSVRCDVVCIIEFDISFALDDETVQTVFTDGPAYFCNKFPHKDRSLL